MEDKVIGCEAVINATDTQYQEREIDKIMGMNLIGSTEFMLGALFNLSLLILVFLAAAGIFCGLCIDISTLFDWVFCGGRKWRNKRQITKEREKREKLKEQQSSVTRPTSGQDEHHIDYDDLELERLYSVLTVIFILLVAVIIIPIHCFQQTTANKLRISDGAGP